MSFQDLESGVPPPGPLTGGSRTPSSEAGAGVFKLAAAVNRFQKLVYSLATPKRHSKEHEKL